MEWLPIYIADTLNHRVRKITVSTGIITTIAGNEYRSYNGDDMAATDAQLSSPSDVAVDVMGNVYIADSENFKVRKISISTGMIATIAYLSNPRGITLDGLGNLYMVDASLNLVIKTSESGGMFTYIAGIGSHDYNGDDIVANFAAVAYVECSLITNVATTDPLANVATTYPLAETRRSWFPINFQLVTGKA